MLLLLIVAIYGCSMCPQIASHVSQRTITIRRPVECSVCQFNAEKLERIYKNNDLKQLEEFFQLWSNCSQQERVITNETLPEFILDAYEIFQDFYNPYNLSRIAKLPPEQSIYQDAPYFIIQEKLIITKRITLEKDDFGDYTSPADFKLTLNDFYPNIEVSEGIPLYLAAYDRDNLLQFLGDESYPLGHGGIMNPARAKGDSRKRQRFLNLFVRIIHGHWSGWHLESHPYVYSVNFNRDYSEAIVDFRIIYEGGEARYKKEQGKWTLIESGLTWME
jgi:hypothetical protein